MKHLTTLSILALTVAIGTASCSNKPKEETAAPVAAVDTAKAKPAVFTPYKAMMVTHTVKDFDKWLTVFKAGDSLNKVFGLTNPGVGRGLDNDKFVVVFSTAADAQKAKDFGASPALKAAMGKAGVTSAPTISLVDVIMDDTTSIPQSERLMVTHHVKDFDAWKKGFDSEGDSARAAHGLVLRAMARGVDDANNVTILFAITDMAKARARAASPELKKVMTDVGVDGPPTITWFKWVKI